jgi:hypothetical protein
MFYDLKNIVDNTSSNFEGEKFFSFLKNAFLQKESITIKISNSESLSSSFLNSSIGEFLDEYGFDNFKSIINIASTKSQLIRIKSYIENYQKLAC